MDRKIIDYRTVVQGTLGDLDYVVKNDIKKGWEPFEQISHIFRNGNFNYIQAMVKYAPEETKLNDETLDTIASEIVALKVEIDDLKNKMCVKEYLDTNDPRHLTEPGLNPECIEPVFLKGYVLQHIKENNTCKLNCWICPYNGNGPRHPLVTMPSKPGVCTINNSSKEPFISFDLVFIQTLIKELKNENS